MARDDARFLELLDRWLTGAFTRADERELQALAAADPFRREAWEGFAAVPETEHAAVLERLRARLQPQRRKRVPLGVWLAAAATLALLVVAVLFLPKPEVDNAAPLASAPAAEQQAETDTTLPDADAGNIAFEPETQAPVPPVTGRSKKSVSPQGPTPSLQSGSATTTAATSAAKDETLATLPRQAETAKETNAEDQPAAVEQTAKIQTIPPPAELAKPAPVAESPDLKLAGKKQESAKQTPLARTAAPAAEPAGGWEKFHAFLSKNARLPEAARNNNVSGRVRLEFTVGPDGKPADVRVTRSLGYGCDEEAMRLIRLFDWTPVGAGPVVVEVPFVR